MANEYDVGDLVRVTATFDDGGIDPTAVQAKVRQPSGTVTTYVYGTNLELVKSSTGIYTIDVDVDAAGTWRIRFESTGSGQAAEDHEFYARTPAVV